MSEHRQPNRVPRDAGRATPTHTRFPVEQVQLSRRNFIKLSSASGLALVAGGTAATAPRPAAAIPTSARIVIAGGGAGGLTAAARLSNILDGAHITIIEPSDIHQYQPGFTLVGSGVYDRSDVLARTADYIPRGVEWVQKKVAEFDPEANRVTTDDGRDLEYDYLVVGTGCELRFDLIDGMSRDLVGREGIGCNFAGADGAAATWEQVQRFIERGGQGVFTTANTPIKCAGAPLKATFLTEDLIRRAGNRDQAQLDLFQFGNRLFGVDVYNDLAAQRYDEKGVDYHFGYEFRAIDPGRRVATFVRSDNSSTQEVDYDYIHITPPMSAPPAVRDSALPWQEGGFAEGGWMEVDQHSLQHRRYANVFAVGDVAGTPIGKTAATVRAHAPVVADNLAALIQDQEPTAHFDGYTSCPLITGIGRASLVEFDYSMEQASSLPFFDQQADRWIWWQVKVRGVKPLYFQMLRGRFLKT